MRDSRFLYECPGWLSFAPAPAATEVPRKRREGNFVIAASNGTGESWAAEKGVGRTHHSYLKLCRRNSLSAVFCRSDWLCGRTIETRLDFKSKRT